MWRRDDTTTGVDTTADDEVGAPVALMIRKLCHVMPSPPILVGTLISVLRNVTNFVISTAWALAAKMTSLLCICTLVARKYPAGSLKLTKFDNRDGRTVHFRAVDAEHLGEFARLAPVEEHRAGAPGCQ